MDYKADKQQKKRKPHPFIAPKRETESPTFNSQTIQRGLADPTMLRSQEVLQLQRLVGNQAVGQMLGRQKTLQSQGLAVQRKSLQVGPANDKYEQEADRVAEQVTRTDGQAMAQREETGKPTSSHFSNIFDVAATQRKPISMVPRPSPVVARWHDSEAEAMRPKGIPTIQRDNLDEDEVMSKRQERASAVAQREATTSHSAGLETDSGFTNRVQTLAGSGQALPADIQADFSTKMGTDLSQVRVHTGGESAKLNRQIQAKAFTHGHDIHFGAGQYNPRSQEGKRLIAHEVTHTVQQTGGRTVQRKPNLIQRNLFKRAKDWFKRGGLTPASINQLRIERMLNNLKRTLAHPVARHYFEKFCNEELSAENLNFLKAVGYNFKTGHLPRLSYQDASVVATQFIEEGSPNEINIGHELRSNTIAEINAGFGTTPHIKLSDQTHNNLQKVKNDVMKNLGDTHNRFIKSGIYKKHIAKLLAGADTRKKVLNEFRL